MTSRLPVACTLLTTIVLAAGQASAQSRDSLLNGAIIGAAIGAGVGIGFTYALRDSDLAAGQYAYAGLVWGAIGAGIGLGVDALFGRSSPRPGTTRPRLLFAPAAGRAVVSAFPGLSRGEGWRPRGVMVQWRW